MAMTSATLGTAHGRDRNESEHCELYCVMHLVHAVVAMGCADASLQSEQQANHWHTSYFEYCALQIPCGWCRLHYKCCLQEVPQAVSESQARGNSPSHHKPSFYEPREYKLLTLYDLLFHSPLTSSPTRSPIFHQYRMCNAG